MKTLLLSIALCAFTVGFWSGRISTKPVNPVRPVVNVSFTAHTVYGNGTNDVLRIDTEEGK